MKALDKSPRHGSAPNDEFVRARLELLARFLGLFSLFTVVLIALVGALVPTLRAPGWPLDVYTVSALVVAQIFGVTWLWSRTVSPPVGKLDVASMIATGAMAGVMILCGPEGETSWKAFGITLVLSARAAMLPSTAERTLWLGLVASLPSVACSFLAAKFVRAPPDPDLALTSATTAAVFLLLSTLVQAATSKVIYLKDALTGKEVLDVTAEKTVSNVSVMNASIAELQVRLNKLKADLTGREATSFLTPMQNPTREDIARQAKMRAALLPPIYLSPGTEVVHVVGRGSPDFVDD